MDPINRLNSLLAVLRQRMAGTPQTERKTAGKRADAPSPSNHGAASITDLKRRLHERIKAVDLDQPGGLARSKQIFLESVIAWELGDVILLDHRLHDMVDTIQKTIEADQHTNDEFCNLLKELKNG